MFPHFLRKALNDNIDLASPHPADVGPQIVLTLPPEFRDAVPRFLSTASAYQRLFAEARTTIKIFSPYVDTSFTAALQNCRVPIRVITTVREGRCKVNPILERAAQTHKVTIRYLHEQRGKAQMYQVHAKMILADRSLAYIGSANFTDTSIHYNLELGMLLTDRPLIDNLHRIFDIFFEPMKS